MLQNHLTYVKGELLFMLVEQYRDMNSLPDGYDYESFYEEIQNAINEIRGIGNLSALERFCEEYSCDAPWGSHYFWIWPYMAPACNRYVVVNDSCKRFYTICAR